MKTNIKTIFFAALMLLSSNAWADNVTLPAGKYYFDFSDAGETVSQVQILIPTNKMSLDGSNPLNTGITQSSDNFSKSGITCLVITISGEVSNGTDQNFMQYYYGSGWRGWFKWSISNLTDLTGNNEYYCKVTSSGFEWQTSGPLPSATPKLYYTAGANGTIDTHTAGGSEVSSGAEVTEGTSVHLVANPDDDYSFYGWVRADGSVASTLADYVFSMPSSSLSLTATFYSNNTDPSISGCEGCFKRKP